MWDILCLHKVNLMSHSNRKKWSISLNHFSCSSVSSNSFFSAFDACEKKKNFKANPLKMIWYNIPIRYIKQTNGSYIFHVCLLNNSFCGHSFPQYVHYMHIAHRSKASIRSRFQYRYQIAVFIVRTLFSFSFIPFTHGANEWINKI